MEDTNNNKVFTTVFIDNKTGATYKVLQKIVVYKNDIVIWQNGNEGIVNNIIWNRTLDIVLIDTKSKDEITKWKKLHSNHNIEQNIIDLKQYREYIN